MRGTVEDVTCVICQKRRMALGSYRGIVTDMQRCGGPHWDPLYCCNDHTEFEIEVWLVKTKRRT